MAKKNNFAWDKNGHYRSDNNQLNIRPPRERVVSADTVNRNKVLDEIAERVKGEKLEDVCMDIAGRDGIKAQFQYLIDHGLVKNTTDLAKLFEDRFKSYEKNLGNSFTR